MNPTDQPSRPPLFRTIAASDGTATLGLRSLRWAAPTALIACLVLAIGTFASTVTYAKRQPTIGALVPGAGALRITELSSGPVVTEANARFVNSPIPVIIHIISATTL